MIERTELRAKRNAQIRKEYQTDFAKGFRRSHILHKLGEKYFLSAKQIEGIIYQKDKAPDLRTTEVRSAQANLANTEVRSY